MGVWTLPGRSLLHLPLEAGLPWARLRVYLELVAPPLPVGFGIRAQLRGEAAKAFRPVEAAAGEPLFCMLEVEGAAGAVVEIEFETGPGVAPAPGDPRLVGIGVRSVMVCRRDDLASRLDYLERAALPRLVQ